MITSDELLDLDNGIFFEAIQQTTVSRNLADIASLSATETDTDDEDDDEDNPMQCGLFALHKCKYQEKSFKPPRKTMWIGCT